MQPTSATPGHARSSAAADAAPCASGAGSRTPLRHRMASVFAAATLGALLVGCAMPKHPDAEAAPPDPFNPAATQLLDNTDWALADWKLKAGGARDIPGGPSGVGGEPVTLVLSTESGVRRASGFAGCNRYTGTYMLKDGKLSFGPLAATRMACATLGGKVESTYLDALTHIEHSGVDMRKPQELQLILDNGDTLVFTRRAQ
jgi:heat shock protein HslJ